MSNYTRMELGRCRFCGREEAIWAENKYDADEEATEKCSCERAVRRKKFEKAYDALEAITCDKVLDKTAIDSISFMRTKLKDIEVKAQKAGNNAIF